MRYWSRKLRFGKPSLAWKLCDLIPLAAAVSSVVSIIFIQSFIHAFIVFAYKFNSSFNWSCYMTNNLLIFYSLILYSLYYTGLYIIYSEYMVDLNSHHIKNLKFGSLLLTGPFAVLKRLQRRTLSCFIKVIPRTVPQANC